MKKNELDEVFKSTAEDDDELALDEETLEEGDDAESEDALDAAIDEAFDSTDPEARREAFKNAVRLCKY